ncbi:MAG: hypothetical protein Q9163_000477 [Psora crenata]
MVVNYSKWDALELSDDSDIEVHPNVDKRSFIRAKQNQIHHERDKRRHEIKTLKYERTINDGLLGRIDALLAAFREHAAQAVGVDSDEFIMNAMVDTALLPDEDKPPEPPEGVHYKEKQPKYSEMIAGLVDQVKKDIGDQPENWYAKYKAGIEQHKAKVQNLQRDLLSRLAELEKEESRKITSDSIHTGFNQSSVTKEKEKPKTTPKTKGKVETVEVLNPGAANKDQLEHLAGSGQTLGSQVDEPTDKAIGDDDEFEPTELGKSFAKIELGKYHECLRFISENPEILAEKETDGLLMEAFDAQLAGKATYAKQCVHQGLLIQYCRSLGKDGVGLFFKRITTPGHNAQKIFLDDVNSTYARIRFRTAELAKERAANPKGANDQGGVEQIQLHAVEPGTEIQINIPKANSTEDVEQQARVIFERFPPALQSAMESGSLDKINDVIGKMNVSEAEEIVNQMGESGMLSMEQGVIDSTTEEGQRQLERLEKEAKQGNRPDMSDGPGSNVPLDALET